MRVGRGIGSGKGKTCGRGVKGQKSRTGVAIKGFEGGQMPIFKRLPKRGFNNHTRVEFSHINIGDLQKFIDSKKLSASKKITSADLFEAGFARKNSNGLKLLGDGELKTKIEIEVQKASKKAIELVEKAGGKVSIVELAKPKVEKAAESKKPAAAKKAPAKKSEADKK